jgi:hypothetical protein
MRRIEEDDVRFGAFFLAFLTCCCTFLLEGDTPALFDFACVEMVERGMHTPMSGENGVHLVLE